MPLLRPPPPPTAPPGCGRRRLGGRRTRRSKRRDWAELPLDVLLHVLHKLDHVELMFGGPAMVCRSWHDAVCEPELWRRVDMRGRSRLFRETISLSRMARLSIWFSAGQCQEFFGQKDVDDDLLLFLADRAPLLKSLHLTECCGVTSKAFIEAIKKFPLLEELELWESDINDTGVFEVVATACPRLKHFKHVNDREYPPYRWSVNNREAMSIARMHELRSLKLLRGSLDNKGLKAILDGCGHLESLDIRYCSNVIVDSSLQAKCASVKTKLRYTYVWERYRPEIRPDLNEYFELCGPIGYSISAYNRHRDAGDEHDCRFFFVEEVQTSDSEDSDHSRYFSGAEETEFEYWQCVGA